MSLSALKKIAKRILPQSTLAGIYRHWAKEYIETLNPDFDPGKKTILAFNHFYDQDMRALRKACHDYNFIIVDAPSLVRGAKLYFRHDVIQLEAPYESEALDNRLAWRAECDYILDLLINRFGVDLMLSGSDIYWWVREFIHTGHKRGIKTIIIDKEGSITPLNLKVLATRIAECAPFIADHIFVWSKRQHKYWTVAGVTGDQMTILGQPRSDLFYSENNHEVDQFFPHKRPLITMFSYMDQASIHPDLYPDLADPPNLGWQVMKKETHDLIDSLASRYSDYNFVIKTHPQQPDVPALQKTYHRDNLVVVGGAKIANELILRSELIIAFQTTAVIEAMFMKKNVIYTAWDKNYKRLIPHCLPFHDAPGIVVADSFDKFKSVCDRFFSGDSSDFEFEDDEKIRRDQFINEYLHQPDGHVCQRFFEAAARFMR